MNHSEARIVQVASQYQSSIVLRYNNRFVDAKSLLGLYTTLVDSAEHELHVHGPDEVEARKGMVEVFEKFNLRVQVIGEDG